MIYSRNLSRISLLVFCLVGPSAGRAQVDGKTAKGAAAPPPEVDSAIATIEAFIKSKGVDTGKDGWRKSLAKPPQADFDPGKDYYWVLKTNKGIIKARLRPDVAPMHVSSTIYLTRLGFYDGLVFHRVIPRFMAQGGCPDGTGRSGPGYVYPGEFSPNLRHDKSGLLSMANAGPGTDGSQFFITFAPTPHLDDKHTIFGEVVGGVPTLRLLERAGTQSGRAQESLTIRKCEIHVEGRVNADIASFEKFIKSQKVDKTKPSWRKSLSGPPKAIFDRSKQFYWTLKTNKGDIRIKLLPDVAPKHVASTMYLTLLGFYDGLSFHRVISGFMAQGGCPDGDGRGGPGYQYGGEFAADVKHDRAGLLSMANAGAGTDGSQFFLTFVPTPWLDNKHTIFGEIVGGKDALDKLEKAGSPTGGTSEPLSIRKAEVTIEVAVKPAGTAPASSGKSGASSGKSGG